MQVSNDVQQMYCQAIEVFFRREHSFRLHPLVVYPRSPKMSSVNKLVSDFGCNRTTEHTCLVRVVVVICVDI